MKKVLFLLATVLTLTSCGNKVQDACEEFMKSHCKAPSTYKTIEFKAYDKENFDKTTYDTTYSYKGLTVFPTNAIAKEYAPDEMCDHYSISEISYKVKCTGCMVTLKYEAANSFNVPIQDVVCLFYNETMDEVTTFDDFIDKNTDFKTIEEKDITPCKISEFRKKK